MSSNDIFLTVDPIQRTSIFIFKLLLTLFYYLVNCLYDCFHLQMSEKELSFHAVFFIFFITSNGIVLLVLSLPISLLFNACPEFFFFTAKLYFHILGCIFHHFIYLTLFIFFLYCYVEEYPCLF